MGGAGRLVRGWSEAERRLYPSLISRPDAVEGYLRAVRAVADELRPARTVDALAHAHPQGAEMAKEAARRQGLALEDEGADLVAGAAFSLRYREVLAEQQLEEASRRIREAGRRGGEWVVLYEEGSPESAAVLRYDRLEMRLPDGLGLHAFAEPGAAPDAVAYGVELVRLDPRTGRLEDEGSFERATFENPEAWRQAVEEFRRRRAAP